METQDKFAWRVARALEAKFEAVPSLMSRVLQPKKVDMGDLFRVAVDVREAGAYVQSETTDFHNPTAARTAQGCRWLQPPLWRNAAFARRPPGTNDSSEEIDRAASTLWLEMVEQEHTALLRLLELSPRAEAASLRDGGVLARVEKHRLRAANMIVPADMVAQLVTLGLRPPRNWAVTGDLGTFRTAPLKGVHVWMTRVGGPAKDEVWLFADPEYVGVRAQLVAPFVEPFQEFQGEVLERFAPSNQDAWETVARRGAHQALDGTWIAADYGSGPRVLRQIKALGVAGTEMLYVAVLNPKGMARVPVTHAGA